ncbi:DUF6705 family protein [Flavobacterium limnophilum]|uniref:DUF6705 family protein n=1 Tax=Flavobacterium limnophilum TaxID=3003262 RepID=UPI0024827E9E|nr:DUF6705 family protein [Flavobacterium limnophilum]
MKKLLILGFIILMNLSCKAQILSVENKINYINSANGIPKNITYIKDVNNILDKYVGTWKGTYNNRNYEFILTKYTSNYKNLLEDKLLMRYVISDVNGTIIEDTRALPDTSPYVIKGDYVDGSFYELYYGGKESLCGQIGSIIIDIQPSSNNNTMRLFFTPQQDILSLKDCPNGSATQIMPLNNLILTKQ